LFCALTTPQPRHHRRSSRAHNIQEDRQLPWLHSSLMKKLPLPRTP
jgi:hypothetical protein